jgi:transcriptional regulator with PAS, ATPase and Fis domain
MTVGILEDKKATLAETDIEKLSNNTVKTVKKEEKKTTKSKSRILQTAQLMKKFKNDKQKVADKMGISVATVERNMRKYRSKQKKV